VPSKKLVLESNSHVSIGFAGFGAGRQKALPQKVMPPSNSAHDGDTVVGRALSNVSVRFLGMDTPEISFRLTGTIPFVDISDAKWTAFLADPLKGWVGPALPTGLRSYLAPKFSRKTAPNHARHAAKAKRVLADFIQADVDRYANGKNDDFVFFLRYAHDVIDRYGRLLAYINADIPKGKTRPDTYNERQLQAGVALPYFIWPNLDPFKSQPTLLDAVFGPAEVAKRAADPALARARAWVKQARNAKQGVFSRTDPLILEPFELRFLAGRRTPDRSVIDLSGQIKRLVPPTEYYRVPNAEDRLFIPSEFVPLFTARGW
jgi:endonuclease YncB( thermonuclease family)